MRQIVQQYTILVSENTEDLCVQVNNLIRKHWEPHGSMGHKGGKFYQPMVKVVVPRIANDIDA